MHVYAPADQLHCDRADARRGPGVHGGEGEVSGGGEVRHARVNETMLVYAKPFRISQDVTLKSAAGPTITIKGTLRYQACDDQICFLPKTVPVEWVVGVNYK